MAFWQTITEIAARAACDTGKAVADNDIFSMARVGTIRVGAVIRNDSAALEWFYPDGTRVGAQSITSDGVARWLDTFKLERLALHGRVTLAGLCWQVAGGTTLIAGPKSPFITADDIRIPSTEYPRILASLKGEPIEPRTQTGGEPTPPQATLKHGEALITKWQALAARVAALQDQDLPPTEQEAADRLLSGLNAEIKALNASNAFQSAVTPHLARLEETRKAGGQHDMIEAEIAGWRALLTAFGEAVVVRVPAEEKDPHTQWKVPGTWQFIARDIGKKWMLEEEVRTGERPVVVKIAKYVEGALSNRNIKNARGTFPDAESVKRDALTGITGRKRTGKK
jgi:hypothetical protein